MFQAQFFFFAAHHHGIKNCEIKKKKCCRYPRTHRDRSAESQYRAAKIERIPRIGIRPGDREHFLLVQVAGRVGADQKAEGTDESAEQNVARRGMSEPKDGCSQRIAETNAPAHEKFAGNPHRRASTCLRTASNTTATSKPSKEGSGWSPRL